MLCTEVIKLASRLIYERLVYVEKYKLRSFIILDNVTCQVYLNASFY